MPLARKVDPTSEAELAGFTYEGAFPASWGLYKRTCIGCESSKTQVSPGSIST